MSTTATAPVRLDAPEAFRFTPEHLDAMPSGDRYRYELADGVLLVSASPSRPHQHVVAVFQQAVNHHLGGLFAYPGGMDQRYADDSVFVPDIVVFLPEGPDPILAAPRRLAEVVEVTSPGNRSRDLGLKRRVNERNRVGEYWVIDLQDRAIHVHVLVDEADEVTTHGPDEPAASVLIPGFSIRLVDLLP